MSEIVGHLERQGMLERESDPEDRRRTLVWLTPAGQDTLRRQREVLSTESLATCESCGMPIETGRYCGYCTDETGQLQSFDVRFERMTAWQARRNPGRSREEIERQTLDYMAAMPAWRDHPRVTSRAT